MLFAYGNHYFLNYIITTLRVRHTNISKSPRHKERAALSAFCGSMTVEAAIVIPIFLLAICSVIKLFLLVDFNNALQVDMDNVASHLSCIQYMSEEKDRVAKGYASAMILSGNAAGKSKGLGIAGGKFGIYMNESALSDENEINSLIVRYLWTAVYFPGENSLSLQFVQRCSYIPWIGESIEEKEKSSQEIVFITKNGTVYHKSADCTYLTRYIKKVKSSEVMDFRNSSGGKYYRCEKCAGSSLVKASYVYITVYGNKYHYEKDCRTLKRYIQKISVSEAGDKKCCTKCLKERDNGN